MPKTGFILFLLPIGLELYVGSLLRVSHIAFITYIMIFCLFSDRSKFNILCKWNAFD